MADKVYLDAEGLMRLKEYIDLNYRAITDKVVKAGTGIVISSDGTVSISDNYTANILSQSNDAANRASQSAIVAGNYASQAIQAKNAIDNKIWYGTMEEYNALDSISSSTIYIILHE